MISPIGEIIFFCLFWQGGKNLFTNRTQERFTIQLLQAYNEIDYHY